MLYLHNPNISSLRSETESRRERRIALFTGNYNHNPDGVSLTLNRLVKHLEQRAHTKVLVVGPTVDDPPMDHEGRFFAVPSLPAPGRPDYRISLGLSTEARHELQLFDPTLVHIATPDLLGYQTLKWAQKEDIPVVGSYHTHFSSYLKYYGFEGFEGFLWQYLRWFYNQCTHIYVPTHSMAAVLRSHRINAGLRLWQRGVDTRQFNPDHRSIRWRHSLNIGDHEPVITFVSRLVWEKGLDVYANVIEKLQAMEIPHRSLIVGEGPAREELEQRLPDTVFTGYLNGENLSRAYASSDIFLFPSDTETFGNVTLEAMASGVPTVCANATGSDALVEHQETGYLADPGQTDTFLEHVSTLIKNPGLRYRMGEAARTKAQQYDWDAIMSQLVSYYDEILGLHPTTVSRDAITRPSPLVTAQAS
jgi:glycosyltransferase involved in cell wall biosynthesis